MEQLRTALVIGGAVYEGCDCSLVEVKGLKTAICKVSAVEQWRAALVIGVKTAICKVSAVER